MGTCNATCIGTIVAFLVTVVLLGILLSSAMYLEILHPPAVAGCKLTTCYPRGVQTCLSIPVSYGNPTNVLLRTNKINGSVRIVMCDFEEEKRESLLVGRYEAHAARFEPFSSAIMHLQLDLLGSVSESTIASAASCLLANGQPDTLTYLDGHIHQFRASFYMGRLGRYTLQVEGKCRLPLAAWKNKCGFLPTLLKPAGGCSIFEREKSPADAVTDAIIEGLDLYHEKVGAACDPDNLSFSGTLTELLENWIWLLLVVWSFPFAFLTGTVVSAFLNCTHAFRNVFKSKQQIEREQETELAVWRRSTQVSRKSSMANADVLRSYSMGARPSRPSFYQNRPSFYNSNSDDTYPPPGFHHASSMNPYFTVDPEQHHAQMADPRFRQSTPPQ